MKSCAIPTAIMSLAGVLPPELLENIFLRLEVKPLISLTIICKSWLAFISSPSFIKAHLSFHPKNQHLLLYRPYDTITLFPLNFSGTPPIPTVQIPVPSDCRNLVEYSCLDPPIRLVGSVNGLVCFLLIIPSVYVIIWNPATRRFKKILDPDLAHCNPVCDYVAFVFDSVVGDYKVLCLWGNCGEEQPCRFRMYSCYDNVWKDLNTDFKRHIGAEGGCVTVDGTVYLMAWGNVDWIDSNQGKTVWVSVDVGTEAISVFPGPEHPSYINDAATIMDLGDSVAEVWYPRGIATKFSIDVFVLEKISYLWTKAYSIDTGVRMTLSLHCSENKFLLKRRKGGLLYEGGFFLYDLITKEIMDLGVGEGIVYKPFNYAESLVVLDGMETVGVIGAGEAGQEAGVSTSNRSALSGSDF